MQEITTYIEDDWGDGALTARTDATEGYFLHPSDAQIGDDVEAGDVLKGVSRPEWDTDGSPTVSSGALLIHGTSGEYVRTPTDLTVGSWSIDSRYHSTGNGTNSSLNVILEDSSNWWKAFLREDSWQYAQLKKADAGTTTVVIDSTWAVDTNWHSRKATRDAYGNWELFFDGASQGTATDSFLPAAEVIHITNGTGADASYDNLEVR